MQNTATAVAMYFLQLACYVGKKAGTWEEVDEYIYQNRNNVVNEDGTRRYNNNGFCVEDGFVNLTGLTLTVPELGIIARMCGATIPTGATSGGFAPKPTELLRVKKGRGMLFYEVSTGNKYKLAG